MSLASKIARKIKKFGDELRITRFKLGPNNAKIPYSVDLKGFVVDLKSDELVGALAQGGRKFIISERELETKQFILPPRVGDQITILATEEKFTIEGKPERKSLQGETLVWEIMAKG